MADSTQTEAVCRAKVGMLVLRDCGARAVGACGTCGRPICKAHQCPTATGVACPECAAEDRKTSTEGPARFARRRRGWYRGYGYRPYYYDYGYGHHHYYSDHDYRTFDEDRGEAAERAAVPGEQPEGLPAEAEDAEADEGLGEEPEEDFGPGDFDES